jgi:hypothetical protein
MLGTAGRDLHNGMDHHPQLRMINLLYDELLTLATHFWDFHGCDGAPGNDKYNAFRRAVKQVGKFDTDINCFNHNNQLIDSHIIAVAGYFQGESRALLNDSYSMSLFVRCETI